MKALAKTAEAVRPMIALALKGIVDALQLARRGACATCVSIRTDAHQARSRRPVLGLKDSHMHTQL
jgi:hypothetical protein